ncbi:MAG: hypothetical protein JJLCMIEE_01687 [Acidimicrobiales bacterium]|nr:MAG: hypothetical protein EDR02_05290 [Actinomycetota bacterium]MBV6508622.1 hypothetical protein [Acidimicrobiales bacterium]RIK08074.1 MAG: hypothetical protein DCC48_01410 [Acidobacteriota bacterium]
MSDSTAGQEAELALSESQRWMIESAARSWGLLLVTGIIWLIFGFVVLSFDYTTVWALAIFAGVWFVFAAVQQFARATVTKDYEWLWIVGGVVSLIAATFAFAWPDSTVVVLATILAWFLLFSGIFDIVMSLGNRDLDLWWLVLIRGVLALGLGLWAVGHPNRSLLVLAVIVGVHAVFTGVVEVVTAFELRQIRREGLAVPAP